MFELKWLWLNLKGDRTRYIFALFLSVAGSALTIVNPYLSQRIVDTFISGDNALDNLTQQRGLLIMLGLGMIGFTLLYGILAVIEVKLLLRFIGKGLPDANPPAEEPDDDPNAPLAFAY